MAFDTLVERSRLASHLEDPEWIVLDCRFDLSDSQAGSQDYRLSHIPGARYAHLDEDLAGPKSSRTGRHPLPDPRALAARLGDWGIDGSRQVICYDDAGGAFAARAWWLLRWLGHARVAVLDGGFKPWVAEGRPVTAEIPPAEATVFEPVPSPRALVSAAYVGDMPNAAGVVIDARAGARFRGESEPIDPVAGHIPGAVNRPFTDNLDANGEFLSPEQLRAALEPLMGTRQPDAVAHMCGSGVTACHNLLAMEIAGLTGSRLYPGSWSEWITDPARPVATGE